MLAYIKGLIYNYSEVLIVAELEGWIGILTADGCIAKGCEEHGTD